MNRRTGQIVVSGALLALGIALAVGTWLLPNPSTFAQVGPRLFPALIAGGFILISALLLKEALLTSLHNAIKDDNKPINWHATAWLAVAATVQMALISRLGFILTSTLLFFAVARALGSRRALRDVLVGIVMTTTVFFLFTEALTLSLPWGDWLPNLPQIAEEQPVDIPTETPSEGLPGDPPAQSSDEAKGAK